MSNDRKRPLTNHTCVASALVAIGGMSSAHALELGEIQVQSYLGQPLRASIAYALAPNEQLSDYCVSVSSAASGLPTISRTRVTLRDGAIILTGTDAVREPMISARVTINCPYTPNLSREYLMFVDPPGFQSVQAAVTPQAATAPVDGNTRQSPVEAVTRSAPLQEGERYRVKAGESLSEIVQRIDDRKLPLWPAVDAVFAANPSAFLDDDPNRLKAGSWLTIPTLVGSEVEVATSAPQPAASRPAQAPEPTPKVVTDDAAAETPTNLNDLVAAEASRPATTEAAATADVLDESNPYVAAQQELVIPDTQIESPEQTPAFGAADSPNGAVARVVEPNPASTSFPPALLWSIGGIGLIAALLLFRRRFRDNDGDDAPQADSVADETLEVRSDDFGLDDDSPTDRNLALDAAIVVSRDNNHGIDVDFTEAFDGTTELDLDLDAADAEAAEAEKSAQTDIIPPPQVEGSSILEEEVLPDDDEYDVSMIVDVTKMPDPNDVTARDLQAVEVDAEDDDYTVNTHADLEILEQDYQDELSATQALNLEIERAAQKLNEQLAEDDDDTIEQTANVHVGDISEMEVSRSDAALNEASVSAEDDVTIGDDETTGTNELLQVGEKDDETAVLNRDDDTARLPVEDKTAEMENMSRDDETVEVMTSDGDRTVEIITRDDDDETVEMEIESGRVNTRNG